MKTDIHENFTFKPTVRLSSIADIANSNATNDWTKP